MILEKFFDYYFKAISPDVLAIYQDLLPGKKDLATNYANMFNTNDAPALSFLLKFYQQTASLRAKNPKQSIAFCEPDNICFPFFVDNILQLIQDKTKSKLAAQLGDDLEDIKKISTILNNDRELRNWFRGEIGKSLSQSALFSFNEITALLNFSSGGESSFLRFALPHYEHMTGHMLDAGCGSGFSTLIMSQYFTVSAIDACGPRIKRASAMFNLIQQNEKTLFPEILCLIEKELQGMNVNLNVEMFQQLLTHPIKNASFTKGSLDYLPFSDEYFDGINFLDVLEHTYDPKKIIKEFKRVMKKKARIFVTVPTLYGKVEQVFYEDLAGTLLPAMLHLHHFDHAALRQLFNEKEFREIEVVPFDLINWTDFVEIAGKSSLSDLAKQLKGKKTAEVPRQLFAVYEKI